MALCESRDPLEHTSLYQRAESEDSDAEGALGNVNKIVMRPPGHSGKAKKGHICFDATFETGNLGRVDLVSEFEYDLFIRPDTCGPRLRMWFNFTVDNVKANQRVIFNIVNVSKSANLFRQGMTPLVKSTTRPKWQRLPREQVFYYRSAQHQNHYVLSFAFAFDREDDVYQFTLTYPYSYTRYLGHLDNLCSRMSCTKRETLAKSIQKRHVDLVTVTSDFGDTERPKKVVVVLARVHPGESPSSFVCQGLMDFLVSAHPIAQILRSYVIFKIIPMLNPDGVFLGNYRSTVMGLDLNRSWDRISEWIHPTLYATRSLLKALDKNAHTPLDCVLDLHAHSNATGVFVYGNTYDDVYRYERHIVLPKLLAQCAEGYEFNSTRYNQDHSKAGTARRYLCSILRSQVNCYSIEVSIYGYNKKEVSDIVPYTEEGYYRLGRNLARIFLEYYKLTGFIPLELPDQPSSKRKQLRSKSQSPKQPKPRTVRIPATLHLASIYEYFREDAEPLPSARHRSMSGTRMAQQPGTGIASETGTGVGGCSSRSYRFRSPGAPLARMQALTERPAAEPRLTIIDFNQLTRGGLDLAASKNRPTIPRRSIKSRR